MADDEVSLQEIRKRRKAALEKVRTLIISNRAGYGLVVRPDEVASEQEYLDEIKRLEHMKRRPKPARRR